MVNRRRTVFGIKPRGNDSRELHGMAIIEYYTGQALMGIMANDALINDLATTHGLGTDEFHTAITDLACAQARSTLENCDALYEAQYGK